MDKKVAPAAAPTSAYQKMLEEARARRALALAMFRKDQTYEQIGTALGVSHQRAHQLVTKAMAEEKAAGR